MLCHSTNNDYLWPNCSVIEFQGLEREMVRKRYAGVGVGEGGGAAFGTLTGFTVPISILVMENFFFRYYSTAIYV